MTEGDDRMTAVERRLDAIGDDVRVLKDDVRVLKDDVRGLRVLYEHHDSQIRTIAEVQAHHGRQLEEHGQLLREIKLQLAPLKDLRDFVGRIAANRETASLPWKGTRAWRNAFGPPPLHTPSSHADSGAPSVAVSLSNGSTSGSRFVQSMPTIP